MTQNLIFLTIATFAGFGGGVFAVVLLEAAKKLQERRNNDRA